MMGDKGVWTGYLTDALAAQGCSAKVLCKGYPANCQINVCRKKLTRDDHDTPA
jgi:hypothetical protein